MHPFIISIIFMLFPLQVTLVSAERLCRYVPATSLPKDLGGTQDFNHMDWIRTCVDQATDSNRNSRELSNEFTNDNKALEANRRAVELFTAGTHLTSSSSQENHLGERTNSAGSLHNTVPEPRGSSESLNSMGISNGDKHKDDSPEDGSIKINGMSSSSSELEVDDTPDAVMNQPGIMGNGDTNVRSADLMGSGNILSRSDADGLSCGEPESPHLNLPDPLIITLKTFQLKKSIVTNVSTSPTVMV